MEDLSFEKISEIKRQTTRTTIKMLKDFYECFFGEDSFFADEIKERGNKLLNVQNKYYFYHINERFFLFLPNKKVCRTSEGRRCAPTTNGECKYSLIELNDLNLNYELSNDFFRELIIEGKSIASELSSRVINAETIGEMPMDNYIEVLSFIDEMIENKKQIEKEFLEQIGKNENVIYNAKRFMKIFQEKNAKEEFKKDKRNLIQLKEERTI